MDISCISFARTLSAHSDLTQQIRLLDSRKSFKHWPSRTPAVLKSGLISSSMKSYRLSELSQAEVNSLKARPHIDFSSIFGVVNPIVEDVRSRGDAAVKDYTSHFDKVTIDEVIELVADLPDPELEAGVQQAFDVAYSNIHAFHVSQKAPEKIVENMSTGVRCKRVARCIGSVGLYVPGGTAVLPSTALMLAVVRQRRRSNAEVTSSVRTKHAVVNC